VFAVLMQSRAESIPHPRDVRSSEGGYRGHMGHGGIAGSAGLKYLVTDATYGSEVSKPRLLSGKVAPARRRDARRTLAREAAPKLKHRITPRSASATSRLSKCDRIRDSAGLHFRADEAEKRGGNSRYGGKQRGWIIVEIVRELRSRGSLSSALSATWRETLFLMIFRKEGKRGGGREEGKRLDVSLADAETLAASCFQFDVNCVFKIPPAHCKRERSG